MSDASQDERLKRLASWRVKRREVPSLAKLMPAFETQRIKPLKQAGTLVNIWLAHVPGDLASRTAIRSFRAGVLRITVADSSTHFQLDRLLRQHLLQDLRDSFRGNLRSVKLDVGQVAMDP